MTYYKCGNHVIGIDYDECAENPREWGQDEHDWHLACAQHRHYDLPHEYHGTMTIDELDENPDYEVVPLSFGDHSRIWLEAGVHEGWDITFCGYAWRKLGGYDSNLQDDLQDVLNVWNTWANGEVMQAVLYDLDGNIVDSIGGLYNDCEINAVSYVVNFFDAPGFDVDSMTIVEPTYTMSF